MEIILYQIIIFIIIQASDLLSKTIRNIVILLISTFTIYQISTNIYLIFQFATIILAYLTIKPVASFWRKEIELAKKESIVQKKLLKKEYSEMADKMKESKKDFLDAVNTPVEISKKNNDLD